MGRFLSGGSGSIPRSLRQVFTASNPAVAIPSWARLIRFSGVGGGGSGSVGNGADNGSGGGSGAMAVDCLLMIPTGVTAAGITIGAGAAGVSGTSGDITGQAGGSTIIDLGGLVQVRLGGGGGGFRGSSGGGGGGFDFHNDPSGPNPVLPTMLGLMSGVAGASGNSAGSGAGGSTVFGAGGLGFSALITTPGVNGNSARGRGGGGSGTRYVSGAAVTSGSGAAGLAIVEFLEAL